MDYKKVKLGNSNDVPQSIWSTDDNVLCKNNKTLRENLVEKFDDAILEGNLLKLYANGVLKKTLTLPEGTSVVEKFGEIVISKTTTTIKTGSYLHRILYMKLTIATRKKLTGNACTQK